MINSEQKETVRHLALKILAECHPVTRNRKQVQNRIAMEVDFEVPLPDVMSALAFLVELGHAEIIADEFGASDYWKATAKGVQAQERDQRPGIPKRD